MEIFDFLHLTTRRLIAMVVVALLAGAATALVLASDSTDSYEADAIVFLGQVLPADRSTFAVAPFAGDLETLLSLDPTREDVATASGVDDIPITDLSTRQISNGTAVGIRAVAPTAALAETIASEAARVGLSTLLEQERNRAQRNLEAVDRQLLQVRADLETFRGDNGTLDPVFEFLSAADERLALQAELATSDLTAASRETLEARQLELNDEILRLAPLQAPYNELDRALLGAEDTLSDAKQEVAAADALLAGAASGDFVVTTPAAAISNQSTLRAGIVASMIVVLLLSIGLFVKIDRDRSTAQHEELPGPDSDDQRVHQQSSDTEHVEIAEDATEHAPPDDTSTSTSTTAETPTEALTCVCGRVCRTPRGLSVHRRACETHQRSQGPDNSENDAATSETSVDDAQEEPAATVQAQPGAPLRVLVSELGASEDREHSNHRMLTRALETAGLNEGESFTIVNARGDGFTQVRQAEQAIHDGVSVILLIGSDPETSATIAIMADKAGVEIVEQRVHATGFPPPGNGTTTETERVVHAEQAAIEKVRGPRPLIRPTPRWAPAGNDSR